MRAFYIFPCAKKDRACRKAKLNAKMGCQANSTAISRVKLSLYLLLEMFGLSLTAPISYSPTPLHIRRIYKAFALCIVSSTALILSAALTSTVSL